MAATAIHRHGTPLMLDHTPAAGAVNAGDVVLLGNTAGLTCGIAHSDIANSVLGALAGGGGVYEMKNVSNAANYAKVYYDATNTGVTGTSTNNALVGFVEANGGGGANSKCLVRHFPFV